MSPRLRDVLQREGEEGFILRVSLEGLPAGRIDREWAATLRQLPEEVDLGMPDVRAVVVSGSPGGPFCLGTSHRLLEEARGGSLAAATAVLSAYRVADAIAAIQRPVIVAIEGAAHDQGFELALAADLRVAGEGAAFRLGHVLQGLIPWDGGTQRLARVASQAVALDLALTGREVEALEALKLGLVNRVAPQGAALAVAMELAAAIAGGGPIAARYAKEAVHTGLDMTLEQGILLETDLTMVLQTTQDRMEGIRSFLERRAPRFRGE